MDPESNIIEQRRLATKLRRQEESSELNKVDTADVMRLCDLVEALDAWMRQGNFLPKSWEESRRRHQ